MKIKKNGCNIRDVKGKFRIYLKEKWICHLSISSWKHKDLFDVIFMKCLPLKKQAENFFPPVILKLFIQYLISYRLT